jgi:RNA polymerase sigma-70 factor, ECF subfamily
MGKYYSQSSNHPFSISPHSPFQFRQSYNLTTFTSSTTLYFLSLNLVSFVSSKDKTGLHVGNKNPDEDIFDLLKKDINKGFRLVVERYSSKLYWHIRRLVILHEDADDALQNTMINAWRNISNFRSESSIYTWLYKIATNEALALINKRTRNYAISIDDLGGYFANSKEGSSWFDGDEAQLKLHNAILQLPEKQRIVFNLKYFDEMPYEEMSGVLNTSVGALKASYHHAVKKIEDFIKNG